jgi:hypothetical protein
LLLGEDRQQIVGGPHGPGSPSGHQVSEELADKGNAAAADGPERRLGVAGQRTAYASDVFKCLPGQQMTGAVTRFPEACDREGEEGEGRSGRRSSG